jgi:His-Xaa-Ser system protein HxsD
MEPEGGPIAGAVVDFEQSIHSADAIQRAAYKFAASFAVDLQLIGSAYRCTLHPRTEAPLDGFLLADFRSEVLDQTLRERIRTETEGVRNLILAVAFSKLPQDSD